MLVGRRWQPHRELRRRVRPQHVSRVLWRGRARETGDGEGRAPRLRQDLLDRIIRLQARATGERVRKRTTETPAQLTARETQIARLASDGLTNPEIAAQLFMSPRTVEYHLHKVFTKLDISSRNQLHRVLANGMSARPQQSS